MKIEELKKELQRFQHFVLNEAQNDIFKSNYVASLLDGIKTIQHTIDFIDILGEMFCESEVEDE